MKLANLRNFRKVLALLTLVVLGGLGWQVPVEAQQSGKGKILYYRNPMGLPDTSPVPKKDPMGMDYIPVYDSEEPQGNQIRISPEKVQKLGVKTEVASRRTLTRPVRLVGTVQVDERRLYTVAPRFEGWIRRLYVNATGHPVKRGEPLLEVYSPELVSAQQEYLIALQGLHALRESDTQIQAGMEQLAEAALQRLRNWEVPDDELQRLQQGGQAQQLLTLRAPVTGVVLEKAAVQGMRFMPGEALYRIADLSSLWVLADVFEQDLSLVRPGQKVNVTVNAYPGKVFAGQVDFIYPVMNPQTRTARVHIDLPNPNGLLKPAMYAGVELVAGQGAPVVTVPSSAVINSGTRQLVLIDKGEGRYEPRPVKLGVQGGDYVQVLEGVKVGEPVVVSANFLIDAESNLKAALGSFGAPIAEPMPAPAQPGEHTGHAAGPPAMPKGQ
ncbi:MAG: efflux RND transporter periplasmic adaptor subunit [Candidatus Competibacteraceae bacterium]